MSQLPKEIASDPRFANLAPDEKRIPAPVAVALQRDLMADEQIIAIFAVGLSMSRTAYLTTRGVLLYSLTGRLLRRFVGPIPILDGPPSKLHLRDGDRVLRLWDNGIKEPRRIVPSEIAGRALTPNKKLPGIDEITQILVALCVVGFIGSAVVVGVYQSFSELASGVKESASESFGSPPSPPPPPPVRMTYPMPDLVGISMEDLPTRLRGDVGDAFDEYEQWDLSPRGREILWDSNWTVAATVPAAGEDIPREGTIHVFYLRDEEYVWFKKHPTMPALKRGVDFYSQKILFDIDELLDPRYARGFGPRNAPRQVGPISYTPSPSVWPNPAAERKREWQPRSKFRVADYPELVVSSLPRTGQPLRMGQLITILVRPEPYRPVPTSPGGGGGPDVYINNDDDDDFNIPGWLCPTRFC